MTRHERGYDIRSLQGLTSNTRDRSGKRGDPMGKYFHESTFDSHYDGRFAESALPNEERQIHLSHLLRTYLATMNDLGAETWIMHGSLLGWWWNRKIMPWDSDIDVQVTEASLAYLAAYHNMTVHHFAIPAVVGDSTATGPKGSEGRNYLLEVNPHYENASPGDILNVIDARWIDMATGLFIDITALRKDVAAEKAGVPGRMLCKDRHHYLSTDIFPLRESMFEGTPVRVPYAYQELLEEEYGKKALTVTQFHGHVFEQEKMMWVPKFGLAVGP
ncbi:hypothetical protein K504DRAFT_382262 [Pleomassaria siparia CBS 279.74]|uniref:LicD/FKTN/FKRP nucleotidyltransferase domain-containing protein n=1 Tax=Pleomassaria siparia CBS 279.74 TaxID=1314801 RepID=A0A6G1K6H5_9PLEO|nr:hypothetical protein K504DRAFT_382262 [Pleomassaria siparia CBS 279.74]